VWEGTVSAPGGLTLCFRTGLGDYSAERQRARSRSAVRFSSPSLGGPGRNDRGCPTWPRWWRNVSSSG